MKITNISRTYSRSMSFKKPDGTEMWIRHEMSMACEPDETDNIKVVGDGLEEIVRKEVGASIKAEREKVIASFSPKSDEPFPGTTPGMNRMPKL